VKDRFSDGAARFLRRGSGPRNLASARKNFTGRTAVSVGDYPSEAREAVMRKRVSLFLTLIALGCVTGMLSACNTTAGAGKDISATGNAITDTAQDTKDKM
jgi:predicted small secreted protein